MERSQSRLSLSASFEALAIYFPCMNSFDDEDAGDSRRLKGAIQRSTETGLAVEMPSRTLRQASHESIEDSMNSYGSEGNLNYGGVCLASDAQFSDFLGSMGPAQFVGRQTLATTPMGDVEIGLQERNGQLEVDIIQARGLTAKPGSKTLPGDRVGELRADGAEAVHGCGSRATGGAGLDHPGRGLVQALPHLLHGGPSHRPPAPAGIPVVPREHRGALRRALLVLGWGGAPQDGLETTQP
ncbi:PREDICTED: regulating synaptic membrane exocytosis protein 4 isoform X2 [Cercocebus atys]|uniref:regulating synaptic membrane exocytosis protein 4 isoform X2 n=1 Tax=Cercocebus atys TaxID=9531 RepID=UPI0005F4AF9B|nr:PREDICTED: regulating synaptic membrane exocytosis protein 4 isoform X2 [Cercocebus atys]